MASGEQATAAGEVAAMVEGAMEARMAETRRGQLEFNVLALSTGGQYGAYSSGFLTGWSEAGSRPEFDVVTGASAGGIVAPLAFAGSEFDPLLQLNVGVDQGKLFRQRSLLSVLSGADAIYDVSGLERRVRNAIDADLISAIAARRAAGAEVLIGATDLRSGRLDILDVGQVAGDPSLPLDEKLDCVTEAVMATSAIPGLFPPRAVGDALYADAGIRQHVLLEGVAEGIRRATGRRKGSIRVTAHVLINADLAVRPVPVERRLVDVAQRSFDLVIDEGLRASLEETVAVAKRSGWRLRATFAPEFAELECPEDDGLYSACVTQALFEKGRAAALASPAPWVGPDALLERVRAYEGG